jgi:hypothetical protein
MKTDAQPLTYVRLSITKADEAGPWQGIGWCLFVHCVREGKLNDKV